MAARAACRLPACHRRPIPLDDNALRRRRQQGDGWGMAELVRADDWTPGAWSHDAVMDMQAGLDPVRMTQFADDWQAAVDEIRYVLAELSRRVGAQLDEGWRGQGADASVAALRRYVAGSLEGLIACRSLA